MVQISEVPSNSCGAEARTIPENLQMCFPNKKRMNEEMNQN